jgi:hypothetical protein
MLHGGNGSMSKTANVMGLAEYGSCLCLHLGFCGAGVWSLWCCEEDAGAWEVLVLRPLFHFGCSKRQKDLEEACMVHELWCLLKWT